MTAPVIKPKPMESLEELAVPELGATLPIAGDAAVALAAATADGSDGATAAIASAARSRLFASLARRRDGGAYEVFADRIARMFDLSVERAAELLRKLEEPSAWRPGIAPGIDMIPVKPGPKFAGAIAAFGKLRPGSTFPRHAHQGEELTLVMAGGFRDSSGVEIERGDELFEADGSEHDFTVLEGEDCIAAVIVHGSIDLK